MDKLAWSNGIKPMRSHKSDNPNLKKSTIATEEDKAATSVQAQPVQAQPVQAQPVQAQPVQAQPVQAQPVQAQPVQAQPVQAQPVQAQPVQAQPVQAQPVQAQPVQAQPVQAQPTQALEESYKQEELSLNFNKALPGDYGLNNTSYEFSNNKREDSLTKSHTRYLVSRACSNPFLTHLNYVDDISNQAEFLIPKNSNMEFK